MVVLTAIKGYFLILILNLYTGPIAVPMNPSFDSLAACETAGEVLIRKTKIYPEESELMFGSEVGYICTPVPPRSIGLGEEQKW